MNASNFHVSSANSNFDHFNLQKATFSSQCVCDEGPVNPGEKSVGGLSIGSILLIVYVKLFIISYQEKKIFS